MTLRIVVHVVVLQSSDISGYNQCIGSTKPKNVERKDNQQKDIVEEQKKSLLTPWCRRRKLVLHRIPTHHILSGTSSLALVVAAALHVPETMLWYGGHTDNNGQTNNETVDRKTAIVGRTRYRQGLAGHLKNIPVVAQKPKAPLYR
jgi:hypothetical protein